MSNIDTTPAEEKVTAAAGTADERRDYSWDFRNAVSNYAFLVVSQGAIIGLSFLNFWLMTRFLGAEGYGGVIALITMSQMAQTMALWTNIVLLRIGVEEFVVKGAISETFWNRSAILTGNVAFLLASAPLWLSLLGGSMKIEPHLQIFVLIHFVVALVSNHFLFSLQAVKLIRLQSVLQIVERAFILVLIGIVFYFSQLTLINSFLIYALAPLITISIALVKVFPFIRRNVKLEWAVMKKLIIFALPFAPLTLIGFFGTNYFDSLFIAAYQTKKDVGIYSTAYQYAGIGTNFLVLANSLLLPMFITLLTQKKASTVTIYIEKVLPLIVMLWSCYCCVISFGAQYLFPLVFREEFAAASPIATIIITSAVIGSAGYTGFVPFLLSHSLNSKNMQMGLLTAGSNALANILLVPRYGLKGCAVATLISSVVFFFFSMFVYLNQQKKSISYLRDVILATIFGSICTYLSGATIFGGVVCVAATVLVLIIKRSTVINLRQTIAAARG